MKLYLKTRDFSVSNETFELHWHEELEMLVTLPQPKNLDAYYESDDYISHTDAKTSLTDRLYQAVKRVNLKNKLQLVDNQKDNNKSILDIGAGTGDFLVTARKAGYDITGVEPNARARQLATNKGIVLQPSIANLPEKRFGSITLWHVLEHLPNLDDQIKSIVSLLEENGTLFVAVPNFKSYDARHYGAFWAGYDVPRHLWHFSKKAVAQLFDRYGMQVVAIHPMWFDAFYVSLLSEKYKRGKLSLVRAFLVGLQSNLAALFTKEPSSLIYCIKRRK
ncbi:MAG: class I SAM-dependent methyltransferase [Allomuricauda sp.]